MIDDRRLRGDPFERCRILSLPNGPVPLPNKFSEGTALQFVLPVGTTIPDAWPAPPAPRVGGAGGLEW